MGFDDTCARREKVDNRPKRFWEEVNVIKVQAARVDVFPMLRGQNESDVSNCFQGISVVTLNQKSFCS